MKEFSVAIVGITGAVGEVMLEILESRDFPVKDLFLLASEKSAGKRYQYKSKNFSVQALSQFDFKKADIALFSAGSSISREYAPRAAKEGCVVIDNTSLFRRENHIPLIIPEVNPSKLERFKDSNIIANPNCSTIGMLVALQPIRSAVGIRRINVATYQAVSGSGKKGIEELAGQTARILNAQPIESTVYPQQIAFNALPAIGDLEENGYTNEEMKMVWETQKIFEDDSILVNPTCVRIPVFYGHGEAIHVETKSPITTEKALELLNNAPGVCVIDQKDPIDFPTAVRDSGGKDPVFVGRVRQDISTDRGLSMWIVSDNVRKGAALNSVQIAELLKDYL